MKLKYLPVFLFLILTATSLSGQFPRFRALAFYSEDVEPAHVEFARAALTFFQDLTIGDGFVLDITDNMDDLVRKDLSLYSVILMLNDFPHSEEQREAFRNYMENGGGWFGFHVAAYNDSDTQWPWFLDFIGGGVFWRNNWPPMPAMVVVSPMHEVTRSLPNTFMAPANEWYQWKPSPRENPDVEVLVSLAQNNYPLGLKDIIPDGDCPVVWTNRNYRMIYMNMGHGKHIFSDATQNQLIISGFRWVVASDRKGNVFE